MRIIRAGVGLYEDRSYPEAPADHPDPVDLLSDPQDCVLEESTASGMINWRLISGHEFVMPKRARVILWVSDFDGRWLCWIRPNIDRVHLAHDRLTFEEQAPSHVDIPMVLRESEHRSLTDPIFAARLEIARQVVKAQMTTSWAQADKVVTLAAAVALYLADKPLSSLGLIDNVGASTTTQPPQGGPSA